jgi:hypothetical protein
MLGNLWRAMTSTHDSDMVSADADMARRLNEQWRTLCNNCEIHPKNPGYELCTACYQSMRRDNDSDSDDDYLPEDATYDQIVAWERRRNEEDKVSQEHLTSQLPSIKFTKACKKRKTETDDQTCGICMECYVDDDTLSILPCTHRYHTDCIRPWFAQGETTCPHCKFDVTDAFKFS